MTKQPRCGHCLDTGHVCEDHPEYPWEAIVGAVPGHEEHGGIGQPCGFCCSPVEQTGEHTAEFAFVPDWARPAPQ